MKNLWLSIVVSVFLSFGSFAQGQALRCDLYFLSTPEFLANPPHLGLAPKMKEYPISIRIHHPEEHPKGLPIDELKARLQLVVSHHISWVIPSFSQKIFFSLFKETICPANTNDEESWGLLDHLLEKELSAQDNNPPSLCITKKTIGTMEIFGQSKKSLKAALTFFDPPHHLIVQRDFPIEKWIIIDSPKEVAIMYISRL